jgi:SAM-dependent methyltransferase
MNPQHQIISYYDSFDARLIYSLFRGVRHFGYFPTGHERISIRAAQVLMTDQLGDALGLTPGSLVLDAGCGEGPVALRLAQTRGVHVVGVDLVERSIRHAERKARRLGLQQSVTFHVLDYTTLPFPDDTFDAVYTMETLVHAPDYRAALAEFRRVLKIGGRIALFEYTISPNDELTPQQQRIGTFVAEGSGMHSLPYFVHGSLPGVLEGAGFDDVEATDITERVMPMYKRMYRWLWLPYQVIRVLRLRKWFVTITSVAETYPHVAQHHVWRYAVLTARKPR